MHYTRLVLCGADVNESFCDSSTVHSCLSKLGVPQAAVRKGLTNNAYRALTVGLGKPYQPRDAKSAAAQVRTRVRLG